MLSWTVLVTFVIAASHDPAGVTGKKMIALKQETPFLSVPPPRFLSLLRVVIWQIDDGCVFVESVTMFVTLVSAPNDDSTL